ncbi:MAG: hypothetical protein R2697_07725 [Ilumatobacteraceae bacterium]
MIRSTRSGTAIFTVPSGPIKCAAPQKIAYLACDHWRKEGCSTTSTSAWSCRRHLHVRYPGDRRQPRQGRRRLRDHPAHLLEGDAIDGGG